MMPVLTATADATGVATVLPPYSLADGTYAVAARQVVGGVQGPLSAPVVFSMPNPAKSATLDIISRMSVAPPAGRAEAMYALVSALMAPGIWPRLDLLDVLAAHHEQAGRLNWIRPAYDLAPYSSPIFTVNRGFKGDGAYAYMEAAGYNPSAIAGNLTLNSVTLGLWVLTPSTGTGIDLYTGSGWLARRNTGTDWHYRVHDGTSSFGPNGDTPGLYVGSRTNAASKSLYKNGVPVATVAVASTIVSSRLSLLGLSGGNYSTVEIAVAFAGASLTDAQHGALYAALRAYLITIGAIIA